MKKSILLCLLLFLIVLPVNAQDFGIEDGVLYSYSGTDKIVNIPSGVTEIDTNVFAYNTSIQQAILPDGLEIIGDGAFIGCSNLTSINIPDGVTTIGDYALNTSYQGWSKLMDVTLPDSVSSIGENAFEIHSTTIWANENSYSAKWAKENGYSFQRLGNNDSVFDVIDIEEDGKYLLRYRGEDMNVVIPAGLVETIGQVVFYRSEHGRFVQSVTIQEGVKRIDWMAFMYCANLTNVILPESLTTIRGRAFEGCSSLSSILVPKNVTEIGMKAFPEKTVILAYKGSYAAKWGLDNGYTVKYVDESPAITQFSIYDSENHDLTGQTVVLDITSGETLTLKAIGPDGSELAVTWKSSSAAVAEVTNGLVTPKKAGTAKITASYVEEKKTISETMTVKVVSKVLPGNITISGPESIAVGKTGKFAAKIGTQTPAPTNKAIVWVLGEGASGKVTVSSSGVVTGKAATTSPVEIKACAKDSLAADGTYANCVSAAVGVTTAAADVKIELIDGTTTLDAGETVHLKAVVNPADASQDVEWAAKSSKVAEVTINADNTVTVKALAKGTITIKATTTDGTKKSATVKLTVGVKVKDGMLSIKEAPDTVAVKKSLKLTAVFNPVPSNKKVVWNIVEGDANITLKNGTVAGVKPGHAVVQVCSEENPDVCVSKDITVVAPVTSVKLVPAKPQTLDIGGGSEEFEVEAVILPENATIKELNWTSSKPEVAEVDSEGKVTAKGVGTTVITATAADGSKKSAKLTVKVVSKVQEGSLTIEGEPTVELKQTMQMKWSFSQPNAPTNQKLTWKSSAPKVASVTAKGLVKGLTAGTATITAASVDNKAITASWDIMVGGLKSDEPVMADASETDAVAVIAEEPVAEPEEPDVIPEETETAENAAEETTEPHFAVEETWMQVGESVILDVVNPDGAAVMVGLDGDTDAVLWNEELRMLTSIGEAEVTAFLSTIDPVEVKSMMAIHIISAMPEEEEVSEESGEAEGVVTEGGEDGVIESAEPAEGEDTNEAAEAADGGENIEAVEPSEGEGSADAENAAEENADDEAEEVSENQEAEEPAEVTEAPAAEPVEIIIRDLDEDEALSGEATGFVVIDRERFELDDETLSGLVFEIKDEFVAKLTTQSVEDLLVNGIEIQLLAEGETRLVIKQEGEAEPLREIRLVVNAAPAAEEAEPAEEEVSEPAAEPVEEQEEAESGEETIVNSSLPKPEAEAEGEEIPAEVPETEEPAAE